VLGIGTKMEHEQRKTCALCGQEKQTDDFHKNKSKSDGLDSRCKKCVLEAKAKKYKKQKKDLRERNKFRSSIVGSLSDVSTQEFAKIIGSSFKECLRNGKSG